MEAVGFGGLADESSHRPDQTAVGNNLRSAWKTKLEREGKLNSEAGSVRISSSARLTRKSSG